MRLCAFAWALSALLPRPQTTAWAADVQDADAAADLAVLSRRRVADLAEFPDPSWFGSVQGWIDAQRPDGTWADVNYLSGCAARRANWPIQEHWNRIITLAAAWSGASAVADRRWANSAEAWEAISKALDYWFGNDYEPAACMGNGGNATLGCPCGTPGLWNTNWYGQAILIPQLSSTACLLVRDGNLSQEQRQGCVRLTKRTYDNIDLSYGTGGNLTAANVVLVLQSAVSLGLFTSNATIVENAMSRAFSVMTFSDVAGQDGLHRDGSFLQHDGILYNGNYGKDLLNVFIQLEGEAIGTRFAANDTTRKAMSTYIKGNEWMIFTDQQRKQEHWDFNVIGRFVSYPTQDLQASADINFNVTKLARAVADFSGPYYVNDTIRRLLSNGTDPLVGNKAFWASDYMVHRRPSFTITNKMLSTRSANSELVNGANPLGYHLGQGTLFTYVDGAEYRDVWASWDWNLIPGTTVVRGRPALAATPVKHRGKRDFVGVVSDGRVGAAVEDYLDPHDGHLAYKKAWFYLGDAVLVSLLDVRTRDPDAPVITVLENRAQAADGGGGAFVDGARVPLGNGTTTLEAVGRTLFYGGNGYLAYGAPFALALAESPRTGNWSAISTSAAGPATVPVFSAHAALAHAPGAYSYALLPATTRRALAAQAATPSWVPVGGDAAARGVSGAAGRGVLAVVFWPGGGGGGGVLRVDLADVGWADAGTVEVSSRAPGVYLLTGSGGGGGGRAVRLQVSAADPTQRLATAGLALRFERRTECGGAARARLDFEFALPTGGMAGSTVQKTASLELW